MQYGAATGGNRVNHHHGRPQSDTGNPGLVGSLEFTVVVTDIRRRTPHVESDHLAETGRLTDPRHPHHPTGRAGENGILSVEKPGVREAPIRSHEFEAAPLRPGASEFRGNPVDIPPDDRRQVGIDHRGIPPRNVFHQGADFVADRHLGVADGLCHGPQRRLVLRISIAMHEDDGDRSDPPTIVTFQSSPGGIPVEGCDHIPVSIHTLLHLQDITVEHFRQSDIQCEQIRAGSDIRFGADP